jgi:hypothetical protein
VGTYDDHVDVLDRELPGVLAVFESPSEVDWSTPTRLEPLDPTSHRNVLELAGHVEWVRAASGRST